MGRKLFVIILSIFFMLPIFWSITSSFKGIGEIFSYPPTFFPKNPTFEGYIKVLKEHDFLLYLRNTLFVAVVATLLTVPVCLMTGYSLAKGTFRSRKFFNGLFAWTLFITAEVTMVPLFIVIRGLGLVNSIWGMIIPAVYTPTGTFAAVQYMRDIPNELLESAKIDGANEWQIFWRIVVPLSKPLMATLSIFSFTWRWNDFVLPLIVVNKKSLFTLQLALASIQEELGPYDWTAVLAFSNLTVIPTLIIFLLFQRWFMRGIMTGGLKY
ncbi:MAG: Binding-protein-dependent transport systems inner membrane component [Thermotoga sp. 47_83]|jgi:alpha-1,4-digalacturonate transport system permease protein|uniref:Binding-protein-dependent transport systems inner membrane component n=1 Tax=Thermotoga petrophila TaxID=93929 RepID=A0A117L3A3_9THEM|nr:MAG: Binding-protein-dependent transport systems inner membrane component [Thermotoga petrophila]KUK33916.1 MAG: Binding-protein-dependent transport systems inner membrane component [Thermotoga sp. 47_83]HAA81803.1 sugar ABC transporter permease [Thermotoga petrophila]HBU00165.1 sugar ABC transporter permease [Thermotoga petrophila]